MALDPELLALSQQVRAHADFPDVSVKTPKRYPDAIDWRDWSTAGVLLGVLHATALEDELGALDVVLTPDGGASIHLDEVEYDGPTLGAAALWGIADLLGLLEGDDDDDDDDDDDNSAEYDDLDNNPLRPAS